MFLVLRFPEQTDRTNCNAARLRAPCVTPIASASNLPIRVLQLCDTERYVDLDFPILDPFAAPLTGVPQLRPRSVVSRSLRMLLKLPGVRTFIFSRAGILRRRMIINYVPPRRAS